MGNGQFCCRSNRSTQQSTISFPFSRSIGPNLSSKTVEFQEWMVVMGSLDEDLPNDFPNHVQFWIQIREIPIRFYTYFIVNHIASTLGDVKTDFNLDAMANMDYACVRVNWPVSKSLVFNRRFRFGPHNGVPISFRYERLQNYCFRCRSLCHDVDECEEPEQEHQMHPPDDDMINEDPSDQMVVIETGPQAAYRRHLSSSPAIEAPPSNLLLEQPRDHDKSISDFIFLNGHKISPGLLTAVYELYIGDPSSTGPSIVAESIQNDPKTKGKSIVPSDFDDQLAVEFKRYHVAKRKRLNYDETVGENSIHQDANGGAVGPVPLLSP